MSRTLSASCALSALLLAGCPGGEMSWPTVETGDTDGAMDTDLSLLDEDGDGYPAIMDCNDSAAWMWAGSNERNADVELNTEADLIAFCAGSCELSLNGDLTVGTAVSDLSTLSCLRSVSGTLSINGNAALSTLSGLDALSTVGNLGIGKNSALGDLSGLAALKSVAGIVAISGNDALTELSGLDALGSIGGSLYISSNNALESVSALYGLSEVGGDVSIQDNLVLPTASAEKLVSEIDSVGGTVTVNGNAP